MAMRSMFLTRQSEPAFSVDIIRNTSCCKKNVWKYGEGLLNVCISSILINLSIFSLHLTCMIEKTLAVTPVECDFLSCVVSKKS